MLHFRYCGTVHVECLSVLAYRSVRDFVKDFKAKNIPCHMLFNNAGEWIRPDGTYTEEGFQVGRYVLSSAFAETPCVC